MNLRYRGVDYQPKNFQVQTITSENYARFLGNTYHIRHPQVSFTSQLSLKKY
ncbi:hypothetical protein Sta7437_2391 [Stanieria cyanosphaera PCC 7437]|uniref:DUF4278 domain-containing protein n=1 Tax=Stanieria cyanosphaera (strain ATCC 29371 / PCC 7437) TaxID=111780 RepID=K9XTK3_STAC7|nr:DUF4278 domain-containing protein [Stanieria cyanosphaera]AFZ35930.1 hypothetical protein Sta7437_2391 [Stanieria cyanosphaera PCC 7437]